MHHLGVYRNKSVCFKVLASDKQLKVILFLQNPLTVYLERSVSDHFVIDT